MRIRTDRAALHQWQRAAVSERFPVVEGTKAVRARRRRWSVLARSDDTARVVCLFGQSGQTDRTDESSIPLTADPIHIHSPSSSQPQRRGIATSASALSRIAYKRHGIPHGMVSLIAYHWYSISNRTEAHVAQIGQSRND
jgi:hypothetical protein